MKRVFNYFGKRNNRKTKIFVTILAAIVVFTTTYSLILPALTIDQETAQQEPGLMLEENQDTSPVVIEDNIEALVQEETAAPETEAPVVTEPETEPQIEETVPEATPEPASPETADSSQTEDAQQQPEGQDLPTEEEG